MTMRDINRINEVTELFNSAWKQFPDLRFWQMINLLFEYVPENKSGTDPFFWEEDVWKEIFSKMSEPREYLLKDESSVSE